MMDNECDGKRKYIVMSPCGRKTEVLAWIDESGKMNTMSSIVLSGEKPKICAKTKERRFEQFFKKVQNGNEFTLTELADIGVDEREFRSVVEHLSGIHYVNPHVNPQEKTN